MCRSIAPSLKLLPFSADYLNDNLIDTIVDKCRVQLLETIHEAAKYAFGFANVFGFAFVWRTILARRLIGVSFFC
jgi:hypothetical protein